MSGGGGGGTSTSISAPLSPDVQGLVNQTAQYLMQAQQAAPISQFLAPQVRQIAGLSPTQQWAGGQIQGLARVPGAGFYAPFGGDGSAPSQAGAGKAPAQSGQTSEVGPQGEPIGTVPGAQAPAAGAGTLTPTSPQEAALAQLAQFMSGPIGSSPMTRAGMQAFETLQRPRIENTLATMGLGRSGAGAEMISQAATQALSPLIQQEIQNRQAGVGQLMGLGGQLSGQQQAATALGLGLGGTEQQTAQAALDASLQDWLRRQSLAVGVTGLSGIPQPQVTTTSTKQSQGGFFGDK